MPPLNTPLKKGRGCMHGLLSCHGWHALSSFVRCDTVTLSPNQIIIRLLFTKRFLLRKPSVFIFNFCLSDFLVFSSSMQKTLAWSEASAGFWEREWCDPVSRFQRQVWQRRSGLVEVDRLTPEEVLRELSYSSRAWLSRKLTPGLVVTLCRGCRTDLRRRRWKKQLRTTVFTCWSMFSSASRKTPRSRTTPPAYDVDSDVQVQIKMNSACLCTRCTLVVVLHTWPTWWQPPPIYPVVERLRFANSFRYETPKLKLKFGERAFSFAGPKAWNSLPSNLQELMNTDNFKKQLKTHLFKLAYEWRIWLCWCTTGHLRCKRRCEIM